MSKAGKIIIWITIALASAGLVIGAVFAYRYLSLRYNREKQGGGETVSVIPKASEEGKSGKKEETRKETEKETAEEKSSEEQTESEQADTKSDPPETEPAGTEGTSAGSESAAVTEEETAAATEEESAAATEDESAAGETAADVFICPDFTMLDTDGNTVSLSDFFDKPTVLNFWASWCPPCREEMPGFDEACKIYGDRIHFVMVNLTDGSRETVDIAKQFIADQGYSFPVYFDTEYLGAYAYGVNSIPMTLFIGEGGELLAYQIGALPEEPLMNQLEKMVR